MTDRYQDAPCLALDCESPSRDRSVPAAPPSSARAYGAHRRPRPRA